jgi:hypothetical protein
MLDYQSSQQENRSSDFRNVNLTASKTEFIASTHYELNDQLFRLLEDIIKIG